METEDDVPTARPGRGAAVPGVVVVFSEGLPCARATALSDRELVIGRDPPEGLRLHDEMASRRHASVQRRDGRFIVRDLASRNGTRVDGEPVTDAVEARDGALVRVGRSLLLLCDDVSPFVDADEASLAAAGLVVGPRLRSALEQIAVVARAELPLVIVGETGVGKELAAQAYHAATERDGPLVPLNCAAIPTGIAERVIFGARKGAFSGANEHAIGSIEAAHGGTLFLDELGELDLEVQAKLLRAIETRQIVRLGDTRVREVDVRIVAATHRDLRVEVAAKRFREDLYFRLGQLPVRVPPLRERREEIPHLVRVALDGVAPDLAPHVELVETCCLRPWPGNVRAILAAVRRAALAARAAGESIVRAEDLDPEAGLPFEQQEPPARPRSAAGLTREEVERAIADAGGNLAAAARALGLHRTQLYRLLDRIGVQPRHRDDT